MSIAAYATAVRNHLRLNLVNFYGDYDAAALTARNTNCKVMVDEHPTANSGQEFISIYGSYLSGKDYMQAIEEEYGLTVAISRKLAWVPQDYRGEKGYIDVHPLTIANEDEEDNFLGAWESITDRCREITKLLGGPYRYKVMNDANTLLTTGSPFTEPLQWFRSDAQPAQVSADHFYSFYEPIPDSDPIFGLLMKIQFKGAIRLQPVSDMDSSATTHGSSELAEFAPDP